MESKNKDKRVPKLRFKGFTDEWEQHKFSDLLINNKDGIRRGPFGSSLKKNSFVRDSNFVVYEQNNAIRNNFRTRYNIPKTKYDELHNFHLMPNDFIMSGAGTIGRIARVPKNINPGVFNQALIRIRINSNIDSNYFLQLMRSPQMQRRLTESNPGSAIENLVPMKEIKNWNIKVPSKREQNYISAILSILDAIISLQQRKLAQLKQLEKGFLQNLFPSKNSDTPKFRFARFHDKWKKIRFKDIFNYERPDKYLVSSDSYLSHGTPVLTANKSFILGYTDEKNIYNKGEAIIFDDFTLESKFVPFDFMVKSSAIKILTVKIGYDLFFAYERLKTANLIHEGHARHYISVVQPTKVMIPSLPEQRKISQFLWSFDNRIAFQQKKIENLKQIKKFLLQNMFI